ncbi:MAG TPA: ABC transporter substrate binding protein [Bacillota bacterium]|nr:ABC transporter substrate binding protein [Bacillota bacterium]
MNRSRLKISVLIIGILLIMAGIFYFQMKSNKTLTGAPVDQTKHGNGPKYRILYVMSYHSPWEWTDDQLAGFQKAMAGVNVEYRSFQLDTKRKSSPQWKEEVSKKARQVIDNWKPDLVFTSDDNAQPMVARHYVNTKIPFVFSAVNGDPLDYGLVPSKNMAGVREQEHYVESVNLLRQIKPGIKKIAIITDDDPTWNNLYERIRKLTPEKLPDIELVSLDLIHTFKDFKKKMMEYQSKVDAVGLIGIHTFKDEDGNNVPWQKVLQWTTLNSKLPDFSFYKDRILYGTLCSVNVSGFEQGYAAGKIARGILVEGRSPDSFPIEFTEKGKPVISLARAKRLGINIKSKILLSTQVVGEFEWEK